MHSWENLFLKSLHYYIHITGCFFSSIAQTKVRVPLYKQYLRHDHIFFQKFNFRPTRCIFILINCSIGAEQSASTNSAILWGMGDDTFGQIGLGTIRLLSSPILMASGVTNLDSA